MDGFTLQSGPLPSSALSSCSCSSRGFTARPGSGGSAGGKCEETCAGFSRSARTRAARKDNPVSRHIKVLGWLDAPEVPMQVVGAEAQRGWPAMWAMVSVVGQVALGNQGSNFLGGQSVSGPDSTVAGHNAEQIVQKLLTTGYPLQLGQVIDHGLEYFFRRALAQDG